MSNSEDLLGTLDIDWFAVNQCNEIAHFASGGTGFIPDEIKSAFSEFEEFADYVFDLDETSEYEIITENLPAFDNEEARDRYLVSFIRMALKGFFSYDVSELVGSNKGYSLIAVPKLPIKINALGQKKNIVSMLPLLKSDTFNSKLLPSAWK